jgi:hypothetical protein
LYINSFLQMGSDIVLSVGLAQLRSSNIDYTACIYTVPREHELTATPQSVGDACATASRVQLLWDVLSHRTWTRDAIEGNPTDWGVAISFGVGWMADKCCRLFERFLQHRQGVTASSVVFLDLWGIAAAAAAVCVRCSGAECCV